MKEVTKDAFYKAINPMNVHPRPEREVTYWETPQRMIVGKSTPGYMQNGPVGYFLADHLS